ncbi:hypothetical protein C8F01DRAFT_670693 [Mycena amicta]|nr:hypothetical protein C8F01DRAFT_670693 [Mycena amicta]
MHCARLLVPTEGFVLMDGKAGSRADMNDEGKSANICKARVQTLSEQCPRRLASFERLTHRLFGHTSSSSSPSPSPTNTWPTCLALPWTWVFPLVRLPRPADDRQKVPRHRVDRRYIVSRATFALCKRRHWLGWAPEYPFRLPLRVSTGTNTPLHPSSRAQSLRDSILLSYPVRNTWPVVRACTQRSHPPPSLPSAPAAHHLPLGTGFRCVYHGHLTPPSKYPHSIFSSTHSTVHRLRIHRPSLSPGVSL